jgi:hypothetical protein
MIRIYRWLAVVFFVIIAGCSNSNNSSESTPPPLSSEKAISHFSLNGVEGVIDETEKTIAVNLPNGSSLTALVANFTTSGVNVKVDSIEQVSGETDNDFTSIVVYTVTAADNSTQDYKVSVTTWGTDTLIDTYKGDNSKGPQVAVDASGNAVAVWSLDDGTQTTIWSNRYIAGSGWGTSTQIEVDDTGGIGNPQVAVDSIGNAVAVWAQGDGSYINTDILSNRYTVGSGWGTPTLIETKDELAYVPQVAVDASGNAVAVWEQHDDDTYNIWSNRYTVGTGWGTATLIETKTSTALGPQVDMNASGNAVAVWLQYDLDYNCVWSNRYTAGTGWGTAKMIDTNTGDSTSPQVAVDASGNAVVVWEKGYKICSNRFTVGKGWGTVATIDIKTGYAYDPQVGIDASGNAVAVWVQYEHGQVDKWDNIWSNRYTAGKGWGTAILIEKNNAGSAKAPQVSVNSSGNAVAIWRQSDGTQGNIWSNRFTFGKGWGTAIKIEAGTWGVADPQVAVDTSGNAVAVWSHYDFSSSSIWSNIYR